MHTARWNFEAFELDETRRELRHKGELLVIEPQPLNLLMLMVRNPGGVLTKNEIFEALWPGRFPSEGVISMCVSKLRQALSIAETELVKTVFGVGYRFDCEVERITDDIAETAAPKLDLTAGDAVPQRPNWILVRRLGKSGDAWLAEHAKTRTRRVFKFTSEPRGLSGLKREVTIFRLLHQSLGDQPCFVPIQDWNFDEPPWFIEADYCAGGSLQEWYEAQGGIARVPLATRLELIAQIADALSQIHALGVLHKDLKPANVFIVPGDDGRPTIRLADFGSGHVLDEERLRQLEITRAGFTIHSPEDTNSNSGTMLYMAPEVKSGQPVTAKADIYALGVMLYQFASGRTGGQFTGGWEQHIDDELLREDIAATANIEPSGRLADAAELARRLRNLDARRKQREAERAAAAAAERAARAAERMKARRLGLILAFAAMTVGFVVSLAMYLQARQAKQIAEAETRRAEKVAAFLGDDMFKAVNTDEHPVKDLTAKDLLDSAAAAVESRFKDEPDIEARIYETLGRSYDFLEHGDEAQKLLEKALQLREQHDGMGASSTVAVAEQLIGLDYLVGKLRATIGHYEQIEAAAQKVLGVSDLRVLHLKVALARGRVQLGEWAQGEADERDVLSRLRAGSTVDPDFELLLLKSLGFVQMDLAKFGAAETNTKFVIEQASRLKGANHIDVATAHARLGRIMYETGRLEEADRELDQATEIASQWARSDGSIALTVRIYRSWLRLKQGRPADAVREVELLKQSLSRSDGEELDQSFAENQPLALAYARLGKIDDAIGIMTAALAASERSLGRTHPTSLSIRLDLAGLLDQSGRTTLAGELLKTTSIDDFQSLPSDHPLTLRWKGLVATPAATHVLQISPTEGVPATFEARARSVRNYSRRY